VRRVQVEHMQQPEISKLLADAKVVYSAGFFITACAPAIEACADHCLANKQTYALVRSLILCLAAGRASPRSSM
jgi:hypothetical protein